MSTKNRDVRKPSNYVILTLRAAAGGEGRYAASGRPWASVRAFLPQGKDKNTDEFRPSIFFTVKAFGEDGEEPDQPVKAIQALQKGDRFTVKGRLALEAWSGNDGETRQTLVIFASSIQPFAAEEAEELEAEPA